MNWFSKSAKSTPAPRTGDALLHAYENNEEITRDECRLLYELVDDPWDLGSDVHYQSFAELIALADKYLDWSKIDWIVDYGCGVGTFTKALKDAHPHIKALGVDFDTARKAAERRFGEQLFDHFYELDAQTTEYDLLNAKMPALDIERICVCFLNSTYYLFKEQRRRKRIDHLARLVRRFEALARSDQSRFLLVTSNHNDRAAVDAINRLGPELVYLSRELTQASRIEQFNARLYTRLWTR